MTNLDFDLILMGSIKHYQTIRSYLKKAKSDYSCDDDEFNTGIMNSYERLKVLFDSNSLDEINSEPIDFSGCVEEFNVNPRRLLIRVVINEENAYFNIDSNDIMILFEGLNNYISDNKNRINNLDDNSAINEKSQINSKLFTELINKYFEGISVSDFINIIELKRCAKKARWIKTKKVDAIRFRMHFNMTYKQMNDCFDFVDGKKLTNGSEKGMSPSKSYGIYKILIQYR